MPKSPCFTLTLEGTKAISVRSPSKDGEKRTEIADFDYRVNSYCCLYANKTRVSKLWFYYFHAISTLSCYYFLDRLAMPSFFNLATTCLKAVGFFNSPDIWESHLLFLLQTFKTL